MKYSMLLLANLVLMFFQNSYAQKEIKRISISDLSFSSIFGETKSDSLHMYCLLGSGYFMAPSSENSDSLITDWLKMHPQAKVIPVATHGPTLTNYPDSKMTYCWLVDNKDTINNYLIKNGCFPGGTMMYPEPFDETFEAIKGSSNNNPYMLVHIEKDVYDTFIDQIKAAEIFAEQNKLGIWGTED